MTLNKIAVLVPGVDLLISQLKSAIRQLLDRKGVRARILDKVNKHGERVIGIILDKNQRSDDRR